MRIWFKMVENAHLIQTETIDDFTEDTRTHKIFRGIDEICYKWDLGKPIWLDANVEEFQKRARTRFTRDNFVEEISFDYLEIHVLEED